MKTIQLTLTDEQYKLLTEGADLYYDCNGYPGVTILAIPIMDKRTLKFKLCEEVDFGINADIFENLIQTAINDSGYPRERIMNLIGKDKPISNLCLLEKAVNSPQGIKTKLDYYESRIRNEEEQEKKIAELRKKNIQ